MSSAEEAILLESYLKSASKIHYGKASKPELYMVPLCADKYKIVFKVH
jgi:hypothetical protein